MLDAVSLSHKQFIRSTIINSIIWDASWQVHMTCSFQSSFVMKYSQWLNVYSCMPQTAKSPVTTLAQKPLNNIQADNVARASHNDNKICDLPIETKQTTQKHTTAWVGWSLSLPHPLAWRSVRNKRVGALGKEQSSVTWSLLSSQSGCGREPTLGTDWQPLRQHQQLKADSWITTTTQINRISHHVWGPIFSCVSEGNLYVSRVSHGSGKIFSSWRDFSVTVLLLPNIRLKARGSADT